MALVALVAAPGAASTLLVTAGTKVPIPATDQSTPQPTLPADSPDVLIIGDSTTVHMLAEFREALAARGLDATIDARSGRTTREGRAVLAAYDVESFDYVAVLLGANGLRANALRDMQALRAAGVDTMATVQAPQRRLVNRAVRRVFGADRIRWAGYADSRADSDDRCQALHPAGVPGARPVPCGGDRRARLLRRAAPGRWEAARAPVQAVRTTRPSGRPGRGRPSAAGPRGWLFA